MYVCRGINSTAVGPPAPPPPPGSETGSATGYIHVCTTDQISNNNICVFINSYITIFFKLS